ncbi:hypothetical protein [Thermococcus sp. MAR1]|uniref:hypothetical protein n=1 Tax=Thermococcus sp. MAR1 TaxID=1638263 RepID=UPI00143B5238|nr:hypothetical protein [Thermococcus sp. MAR1]NJE09339.1 hypothetical protein [Thermococcus sp. MAR1]
MDDRKVFEVLENIVSPREARTVLEKVAPLFVSAEKPAATVIISARREEVVKEIEKLFDEVTALLQAYEAGFFDEEDIKIEVLEGFFRLRELLTELEIVEAVAEVEKIHIISLFDPFLTALGRLAWDDLVDDHKALVEELRQKNGLTAEKLPFPLPDLEEKEPEEKIGFDSDDPRVREVEALLSRILADEAFGDYETG